jgi:hypothetical protein
MTKWLLFWLAVGCVWLIVAPIIAAVVVIGVLVGALIAPKRQRRSTGTTRVRIIVRDHEKSPSQPEG